jgi:hypothetical protein
MNMSAQVVNVLSSVAFIAVLSSIIWWLRSRDTHWSSSDGSRCICQMALALTGSSPKWSEARVVIDSAHAVVMCKSRGKRGRSLSGAWSVIGQPHASHVNVSDAHVRTYALCRRDNADILAILRVPASSRSVSVLDALLPR